jgi:hypothetical protein
VFQSSTVSSPATSVAFIAPSVSPLVTGKTGTNPGIRLYHYDAETGPHLDDYEQGIVISLILFVGSGLFNCTDSSNSDHSFVQRKN